MSRGRTPDVREHGNAGAVYRGVEDAEELAAFVSGNQRPVAIPPKAVAGVDLVKMTVVQVNAVGPDGCVSQHDSRCLAPGKPSERNLWKSGTVVEGPDVVPAMCAAHCAAWHGERRRGCACPLRSWNTSGRQRPSRFGRGRRTCSVRGQGSKLMGTLVDLRRDFDCAGDVEDTSILCPGARCRFPKVSGRSVGMPSQAAILPTPAGVTPIAVPGNRLREGCTER